MKNSGGGSRGDTNHVFDLVRRNAEIVSDVRDAVTRYEPVDQVLDPRATVDDERQAERDLRVHDHLGMLVRG
jgi:hypothetical protein